MKLPYKGMMIGTESERISNPYTGESITLTPQAVAVYDTLKGAERMGLHRVVEQGLDWFKQYYPAEYMVLLD
jgi:hypothetical protein